MKPAKSRIRNNLIFGAMALLPLLILGYVFYKVHDVTKKAATAVAPVLGDSTLYGTGVILLMTVLGLMLLCFLIGALVTSRAGARAFNRVQSTFGDIVPGYKIVTNLMRGVAGNEKAYPPALVSLFAPGTSVLGFVMEDTGGPYLTVFVPSTPIITVGGVHIVERDKVQVMDASSREAAESIGQWGLGMAALLRQEKPAIS
ncbi:MAG: DUF502 domain-containing protein [Methyloceanibacter sp.]|nr:DUF502 domain-containing protein [Methyloceanibacter sp.]